MDNLDRVLITIALCSLWVLITVNGCKDSIQNDRLDSLEQVCNEIEIKDER